MVKHIKEPSFNKITIMTLALGFFAVSLCAASRAAILAWCKISSVVRSSENAPHKSLKNCYRIRNGLDRKCGY